PIVPPPEPTCTKNVMKMPSVDIDCTFYAHTKTRTAYTDCGSCALATKMLGLGLPCQTITTVPGVTYETVTACKTRP
ncbi:hypothetical protein BCR34DRAFT_451701, partial [Clohesyomyces aquaticus]